MPSRRQFLKQSALVSLAPLTPVFLTRTLGAVEPKRDDRVLVVIQLDGGNDGLNTVVPFADDGYARHRKVLRIEEDRLLKLNDQTALHPSMRDAADLFEDGRLSIVQGVGYPNPNRSHFRSMAIWHTARFDVEEHAGPGWLGMACDQMKGTTSGGPQAVFAGAEKLPVALWGRRSIAMSLSSVDDLTLQLPVTPALAAGSDPQGENVARFVRSSVRSAYSSSREFAKSRKSADTADSNYPGSDIASRLELIAQLMKAGSPARVYYTRQPGYDTHAAQILVHAGLLRDFSRALKAFLDDLKGAGLDERVVVVAFSEFGRRVEENASEGTDHGTAGPVFVAGRGVTGGLLGQQPDLTDLEEGDLKMSVDFRQVYATLLEKWLKVPSSDVLAGAFPQLPLLRS